MFRDKWERLKEVGILVPSLVDHVFRGVDESKKQVLLDMMKSYGLIAAFTDVSGESPDEECYFVPALLTSLPDDQKADLSYDDPCPLYFNFPKGFLPHGSFHHFVCKIINTCSELGCTSKPILRHNFAQLLVGEGDCYALVIVCGKRSIKVRGYRDEPTIRLEHGSLNIN